MIAYLSFPLNGTVWSTPTGDHTLMGFIHEASPTSHTNSPEESVGRSNSLHKETHGDPSRSHSFKTITNKNRPYHKPVSWTIRSARRPVGRQQHIRR